MKKNLNKLLTVGIVSGLIALSSNAAMAGMFDDDMDAKQLATVKVGIIDAITKAKAKQTGTPIKAKLEKEDGKLVYDVEFLDNGKEIEMVVDALTGEVTNGDDD